MDSSVLDDLELSSCLLLSVVRFPTILFPIHLVVPSWEICRHHLNGKTCRKALYRVSLSLSLRPRLPFKRTVNVNNFRTQDFSLSRETWNRYGKTHLMNGRGLEMNLEVGILSLLLLYRVTQRHP